MIRRFVNLVSENYKTGVYSLHRLDVSKHLFHQSRADARVVPFLLAGGDSCAGGGDEQPTTLDDIILKKELPSAMTTWSSSNVDYFSLLEGRILCLNKVGTAVLFDPDTNLNVIMPGLNEFKGLVPLSVSVDKEEEGLYIMHGGGPDLNSGYHFDVLRYGPWLDYPWSDWQSLPVPPPFVDKPAVISAYTTVVDGGGDTIICLSTSSVAEGVGTTYYFNTTASCCEWKRAASDDWVLPFTGKAEYVSDLNLWLGFSISSPGYLCAAASDIPLMEDHKPPMSSLVVWPHDHTPKDWMAVKNASKLLSLGSGKFAVAKFFKAATASNTEEEPDEVVVMSGVELEFGGNNKDNNNLLQAGLKLFQHKSICYTCTANNSTAIRYVL